MTQTVSDVRCANPKCLWSGPQHLCDYNADAEHGQFAPWVTLADGSRVIKYCSMQCWSSYRRDQVKLPESQRDPDIGVILCSECGREVRMNSPKRGTRECYCSVDCWPPMLASNQAPMNLSQIQYNALNPCESISFSDLGH